MKANKFLSVAILASVMLAGIANAGSIGRSSSSSSSHSSSSSSHSSSFSSPSKSAPAAAPAPAKSGGIGGTQGSVGVRKSEVTAPVAQNVQQSKPAPAPAQAAGTSTGSSSYSSPSPVYSSPAPVVVQSGGSGFGSSFAGALGGTIVGNALFGNHGNGGGTTVINNGTPSNGTVTTGPSVVDSNGQSVSNGTVVVQQKESMGMGTIILNIILFAILVFVIFIVVFLFYRGFKLTKEYIDKERGVGPNMPFQPTAQFWEIQKAFASADIDKLKTLLGPDMVDEMTANLQPSTISLHNVSHEVRLNTPREFSVWYKFEDDGAEVNQVWHFEKFGSTWQLNGIENV